MSSEITTNKNWFFDLLRACWGVLNFTRKAVLNIIFIIIAIMIFVAISSSKDKPIIFKDNSVLELKLVGQVVEEKASVDPYSEVVNDAMGGHDMSQEILLTDILNVLDFAAEDDKVAMVKLDLQGLQNVGLSKLQEIGIAINRFKETSGKPVIAYGDYYSQAQYYLASHADNVILHPMGAIILDGFGRYGNYFKSALEKLKINSHIFRVGTYKSAIEPYTRDSMSDEAKTANSLWLNQLWTMYKEDVSAQRELDEQHFDETLDGFYQKFVSVDGDFSDLAKKNKWIDETMTHQAFERYIQDQLNEKEPEYISFGKYLDYIDQSFPTLKKDKVAIIVASGTIYDGTAKPGTIGGHSTAKLLKQAREDESVKAVVLRIDSPGGSAFASEVIRNEIEALKEAGKPVVASMSTMGASGGYWIAASTNEIWAAPSTITGSIGIFGMFLTFENSLAELGVYTDGVGTTELAGLSTSRPLPKGMEKIIQLSIENGYRQFINLVATERDMTPQEVDKIGQGRVWSGLEAHKLGLIDKLGYFDDAIASAAEFADLTEYSTITIKQQAKGFEKLIQEFFGMAKIHVDLNDQITTQKPSQLSKLITSVMTDAEQWIKFNDPKHAYIYCLECSVAQ